MKNFLLLIALFLIIWAVFSAFTKKQEVYPENWEIEIPEEFLIPFRPEEKVVLKGTEKVVLKGTEKEPKRGNEKKVSTKKKETKKGNLKHKKKPEHELAESNWYDLRLKTLLEANIKAMEPNNLTK